MTTCIGVIWVFAVGLLVGWGLCRFFARKQNNVRARFLSFVAHEINTPITSLNMTVLNFLQGTFGPLSKDHEPWMKMVRGDVSRLTALVGDLRDLVHLDFHNDLTVTSERVALGAVVEEIAEGAHDAYGRADIPLTLHIEPNLPAIAGDEERLKRIVFSLLEHARKFRMTGGVDLFCSLGKKRTVEVRVEFAGEAYSASDASKALDLYYPVHNPDAQVLAGVGVGLGLPNALIKKQGGQMTFQSSPAGKTCIAFNLPILEENS